MRDLQKPPSSSDEPGVWNRYIKDRGPDRKWLLPYEKDLAVVVQRGLFTNRHFKDTILLLKEIVPYFVTAQLQVKLWLPILMEALLQAQDLKDNKMQIEVLSFLGESHIQSGKHIPALDAFTSALERADQERYPEMLLAVYIGLFKLQWFDLKNPKTDDLVQNALDIAHDIEDLNLKANLHHELARAYIRLAKMQNALAHGQTAYVYWQKLKSEPEIGRAALTLSAVYRYMAFVENEPEHLNQAEDFLRIAHERIDPNEYAGQYTVLAYETGVVCLQRNKGQEALRWFKLTLEKARELEVPHYLAIAHHGIGLAQTNLREYPKSRTHLRKALNLWIDMENSAEESSALQALGYLEGLVGQVELARKYLTWAMEVCETLSDTPQRETLRNHIQASFEELEG